MASKNTLVGKRIVLREKKTGLNWETLLTILVAFFLASIPTLVSIVEAGEQGITFSIIYAQVIIYLLLMPLLSDCWNEDREKTVVRYVEAEIMAEDE